MKLCFRILAAGAVALALALPGRADEVTDKGRAVFKQFQRSVLTVQVALKSKFSMQGMPGQANETRQSLTGAVLDESGLTVMSLSALDPAQMMQNLAGDDVRFKMETELTDLKLLLEDGTEAAAEVVLRDRDLDLAFIRPKAKLPAPLTPLNLADAGKAEVLDTVIGLNRLGSAAGRAYAASAERIAAVVQRPRLFYIPDANMTTSGLGSPAFTLEGKVLGIFVVRALKGKGAGQNLLSAQADSLTGIIVPAEDVLKAAKQAPAVAPEAAAGSASAPAEKKDSGEKK